MNDGDKEGSTKVNVWDALMSRAREVEVRAESVLSSAIQVSHNVKGVSKKDAPSESTHADDMVDNGFEDELRCCLGRIDGKLNETLKELACLK